MEKAENRPITIYASDYDSSKEFYVKKLGFRVLGECIYSNGIRRLDCGLGGVRLVIFRNVVTSDTFPQINIGYNRLCLHTNDLEAGIEKLKAMDIPVADIRTDVKTGGRMTFIRDPDGLVIELHEVHE